MIKKEDGKYLLIKDDTPIAELTYVNFKNYYDVVSTFTHPAHRGAGYAKQLVDEIVLDARKDNKKVKPTCSYVAHLFKSEAYADVRYSSH